MKHKEHPLFWHDVRRWWSQLSARWTVAQVNLAHPGPAVGWPPPLGVELLWLALLGTLLLQTLWTPWWPSPLRWEVGDCRDWSAWRDSLSTESIIGAPTHPSESKALTDPAKDSNPPSAPGILTSTPSNIEAAHRAVRARIAVALEAALANASSTRAETAKPASTTGELPIWIDSLNRILNDPQLFAGLPLPSPPYPDTAWIEAARSQASTTESNPAIFLRNRQILETANPTWFDRAAVARRRLWQLAGLRLVQIAWLLGLVWLLLPTPLGQGNHHWLGLQTTSWRADVREGLWQLLFWAPPTYLVHLAVYWLKVPRDLTHPSTQLLLFGHSGDWFLTIVVALLLAPLAEELLFRGYLHTTLLRQLPTWLATGLTALGFALIHANHFPDPIPLFVFALGLCWAHRRARSLWAPIAMHVGFNTCSILFFLLAAPFQQS